MYVLHSLKDFFSFYCFVNNCYMVIIHQESGFDQIHVAIVIIFFDNKYLS